MSEITKQARGAEMVDDVVEDLQNLQIGAPFIFPTGEGYSEIGFWIPLSGNTHQKVIPRLISRVRIIIFYRILFYSFFL